MQKLVVQILTVIAVLIVVNIASGILAVNFGYPSLWGNTTGIFSEYAVPLNFNWALAHWVSMLPLAYLVAVLPSWDRDAIVKLRWALLAALIALFFVEVRLPHGRLNHIPFALFLVVDCLVLLMVSLAFFTPWRGLFAVVGIMLVMLIGNQLRTQIDWSATTQRPHPVEAIEAPTSFFEEIEWTDEGDHTELFLLVRETVGPNINPDREEICEQAKQTAVLGTSRPVKVDFMVHPWFEAEQKYVYQAGSALLDVTERWQCDFSYPSPAS